MGDEKQYNRYTIHMSPSRALLRYAVFLIYCAVVYLVLYTVFYEPEQQPTPSSVSETPTVVATPPLKATTNTNGTVVAPTPEVTPAPTTSTKDLSGAFEDRAHNGAGTATITTINGKRVLMLSEDFATEAGPDLNVYISDVNDPETSAELHSGSYADLGTLKNTVGTQTYGIPATVDFDVHSVVVYCVSFKVIFTLANLTTL